MAISEILLFEGIPSVRGGRRVAKKRTCVKTKMVYSPVLGRRVRRCAEFSGSGSLSGADLGAMPISMDQIKDIGITGAVAVGGAVVSEKLIAWVAPMVIKKEEIADPKNVKWIGLMEVGAGLVAGFLVGKYAKAPDIGLAVALGPVVVNGLKLVAYFIGPDKPAAATDGYGYAYQSPYRYQDYALGRNPNQGLGVPISQGQFPPAWMYESPYTDQIQSQLPAWAYGA